MRISDWSSDVCSSDLRKLGDEVEVVAEAAEIGGEHQPRSRGGEPGVGALEGIALILGQVEDEAGLVDLHPVGTALRKPSEDLGIGAEQGGQEGQRFDRIALCEHQIADGAEQDGPGLIRSEEHTSELQSLIRISYSFFFFHYKILFFFSFS